MELFILLILVFTMVGLGSMMFPSHGYPRALPRRRIRGLKGREEEEETSSTDRKSRKRKKGSSRSADDERSIHNIWIGDIVTISHLEQDFVVEEHFAMKEKSWTWDEYLLEDGEDEYTLSVADRGKEIYLSHAIDDLKVSYPPPEKIVYENETYKLAESGRAESKRSEEDERQPYKYYNYEGPEQKVLMIEDWEGDIEYFLGEPLQTSDISILPSSSS